jgi:hypothetical protein
MLARRLASIIVTLAFGLSAATATAHGSGKPAALPLWQRLLLGGDYVGYTPQAAPSPLGTLSSTATAAQGFFNDLHPGQAIAELRRDGFRASDSENLNGPAKHGAYSGVLQLRTESGARRIVQFFGRHSLAPCPHTCSVQPIPLKPPDIPGALATERIRRIADSSKPGDQPFELDEVFFTSGPFAYVLLSSGPPNGVDHANFFAAAKRLYDRVKGAPPV